MGMGFLCRPPGDPSRLSHSDELLPSLDVDNLPGVLGGDGVDCLLLEYFDRRDICGRTFGAGIRRTREPKTFLRGEKSLPVRGGSAATVANVLEDQRLRKRRASSDSGHSKQGRVGEVGVFEVNEDVRDEVKSVEKREESESVLKRGSNSSPYISEKGVSGIAGGSGGILPDGAYAREGE